MESPPVVIIKTTSGHELGQLLYLVLLGQGLA